MANDETTCELLTDVLDQLQDSQATLEVIAKNAAPKIPSPVVNIAPAQVNIPPTPARAYECEITERDANGYIRRFTLTPL